MSALFSWERFNQVPIVGIMRNMPRTHLDTLVGIYAASGLTTLEVTMNTAGAPDIIADLVQRYGHQLNIGAGTVCSPEDLDLALTANAQFIVTPILEPDVIRACVGANIPVFPGAFTPSEIHQAWKLGAPMIKVFPAGKLGPDYIKEVLAPLNHIRLLPTGGITLANFADFLRAGAQGVGIGSGLFPEHLIQGDRWDEYQAFLSDFVRGYQALGHTTGNRAKEEGP
jgi:2-dehydro-3-deoxyphosphogluconate aldolase/(4S)-4-hydroxy-2-oxoglutarate aldolase